MTSRELDFSRYAPDRNRPAIWCHTDRQAPGELAILGGHARNAAWHIWRCFVIALAVIWRRICWRIADFYLYVLHTPRAAWTVAGIGWGVGICSSIAYPAILYFMR
jgi:hypothetical protein